jgi:DNA-directed RNA polymerase subunit H (RpoH/RPB5)
MSSSELISIYNSRRTLMEIMASLGYNVDDYNSFSMNEIEAMNKNAQLDMLIESAEKKSKIYIKYLLTAKAIRIKASIEELIEELFDLEAVLQKSDTLVVIVNDEPNDTLVEKITYWYDSRGIFVVVHNIKRLQKNILKHVMVPKHTLLNDEQVEQLKRTYNLTDVKQLPEIGRFDPVALLICMRPGQVCHIERKSITAVSADYYRVCV